MPKLSRRKVLVVGAGVALAGGAGLIETGVVPGRTRFHGVLGLTGDDGVVPDAVRGPAVSGSFASAARRTKVGWTVMYPHGRKADGRLMLTGEFVPMLAKRGLRTDRYGVLGWSMGGYGALLLAADDGSGHVAAAVAMSPALWHKASRTAAGAYDGPEDFRRIRCSAVPWISRMLPCALTVAGTTRSPARSGTCASN